MGEHDGSLVNHCGLIALRGDRLSETYILIPGRLKESQKHRD